MCWRCGSAVERQQGKGRVRAVGYWDVSVVWLYMVHLVYETLPYLFLLPGLPEVDTLSSMPFYHNLPYRTETSETKLSQTFFLL